MKNVEQQQTLLMDPGSLPTVYKMVLRGGDFYTVTEQDLEVYRQAFPLADIDHEMRQMVSWCYSNEAKRKTLRGIRRFMNNWLVGKKSKHEENRLPNSHRLMSTRDTSLADDLTSKEWAK